MKKTVIFGVIAAAVLLLVIATAGCVQQPTPDDDNHTFTGMDVTGKVFVEKNGITYNIGDTMQIVLPYDLTAGMEWNVEKCDNGLSIDKAAYGVGVSGESASHGAHVFTVTAVKEGDFGFTLTEQKTGAKYSDTVHIVKSDAEPLTPRGVFNILLQEDHPVYTGQAYEISIAGDNTAGYEWTAQETEGLIISKPVFTPYQNDGDNAKKGGIYTWRVTAKEPGTFGFKALNLKAGVEEPNGRIIVPLNFAVKA